MATTIKDITQRIIIPGVQWCTYEQLLRDRGDSHGVYLTYDQGMLELMAPSFSHEHANRILAMIVEAVALSYGVDLYPAGSTTFTREDLAQGFEPDSCYYVAHAAAVRGKPTLDLTIDPPPDLVIEIDITRTSLDKFSLYAAVGVPEVWRYTEDTLTIAALCGHAYTTTDTSTILPSLTARQVMEWMQQYDQMTYPTWAAYVRHALEAL
jgi:Uma2 family endonuclease